ncbi:hypothetical protein SAMN05444008_10483 [Cnuella takakiae]|uniref:Pirin N-terminal domain-containing protein n=1 Tax=Cnuella takakiae TaxID=1302690 RepID=A0A1M4XY12_9BACT|nr:pirin family protein [Cnuella takakiae]OLY92984.1 nuclease PIN [Cnuella takakiae]SHE98329.1 hypothetical protein SAMN05444008_10483 [Cnuella takakiae]
MNAPHKPVLAIYTAGYTDYDGLDTWRAMPSRTIAIEQFEPFIFLNHHGPQEFAPGNNGLPFGPHPHKGFETVTFIITGDLMHQDSTGFSSNIQEGGIQWMTAGKGIIHSETSSDLFKEQGGPVEILQLWVNLPASLKNVDPAYRGLQKQDIPALSLQEGKVNLNVVSGKWEETAAPIQSLSDVHLATVQLAGGASWSFTAPEGRRILYYVIRGNATVNGSEVATHDLVDFGMEGTLVHTLANSDILLLVGHAAPNEEPIIAHGPFVMNTQEEIRQAFVDYHDGRLGKWPE